VIAVFAAMDGEVAACFGGTAPEPTSVVDGSPVIQSGDLVVCRTGIGRRSAAVAEAVLRQYEPHAALSVGIAGGLMTGLAVGDLVVCTHIDHESHRHSAEEMSIFCDRELVRDAVAAATELGFAVSEGSSLTVDEVAWGPAEKAAHHAWKKHEIVEMEGFWVAEAASKKGLPFLAVRTISDGALDSLPDLGVMRPDGTIDQDKLLAYLREHPEAGVRLSEVARNSRLALNNLATFLATFLPRIAQLAVR